MSRKFLVCNSCMCLIVLAEMYCVVGIDLILIDLHYELNLQLYQKYISSRTRIIHAKDQYAATNLAVFPISM